MILLDTSVLSAVLRRRKRGTVEEALAARLATLLAGDEQVVIPGIVLQEVMSGLADRRRADHLLKAIRESFPVLLATEGDHLKAAELVSAAAQAGLAVSTPDALIAAQVINRRARLFTSDRDFSGLAKVVALRLY